MALRRDEYHALVAKIKDRPCADCGCRYPPYVMDFDHREGTAKKRGVSKMVNHGGIALKAILVEIDKCDLVCSNCHRIRTYRRKHENRGDADR